MCGASAIERSVLAPDSNELAGSADSNGELDGEGAGELAAGSPAVLPVAFPAAGGDVVGIWALAQPPSIPIMAAAITTTAPSWAVRGVLECIDDLTVEAPARSACM